MMKKTLLMAAALGLLTVPALAQQSPTGQTAGGPARAGIPGQVGGGVPGSQPNVGAAASEASPTAVATRRTTHARKRTHSRKKSAM